MSILIENITLINIIFFYIEYYGYLENIIALYKHESVYNINKANQELYDLLQTEDGAALITKKFM